MKTTVNAHAIVFKSDAKLEDLMLLKKYDRDALCLYGGKDNKEVVFMVDIGRGVGSLNCNGAIFADTTNDAEGKATITVVIPEAVEKVKEYVADTYGEAILNLKKLEAAIPEKVKAVMDQRAEILEDIQVG